MYVQGREDKADKVRAMLANALKAYSPDDPEHSRYTGKGPSKKQGGPQPPEEMARAERISGRMLILPSNTYLFTEQSEGVWDKLEHHIGTRNVPQNMATPWKIFLRTQAVVAVCPDGSVVVTTTQ